MADPKVSPDSSHARPRKLKILMLHGYTQSATLFRAKTRSFEKNLHKAFPASPASPIYALFPGGVQLIYVNGPYRLQPADVPGHEDSAREGSAADELDAWGWWRRDPGGGEYVGITEGLEVIAKAVRDADGVDGVIGFSQGGTAAAMVASLLEAGREQAFDRHAAVDATALPYPPGFKALGTPEDPSSSSPLRFAVSYSGFKAPSPAYQAFYNPPITTPLLIVMGSLDTIVDERWSRALTACGVPGRVQEVWHPGGHFVPTGKDMLGVLVGFVRRWCAPVEEKSDDVNEMELPF